LSPVPVKCGGSTIMVKNFNIINGTWEEVRIERQALRDYTDLA
jgi:hypothetical protein